MIDDPSSTTTWPNMTTDNPDFYTLDEAYVFAQGILWSAYFGIIFSWALYACLCIQMWFYATRFKTEIISSIRYIVWLLFSAETVSTGYLTWAVYVQMIKNWGHDPSWNPSSFGMLFFDCSIASIVHALYAWRIYSLFAKGPCPRKVRWKVIAFVILIGLLSLSQFSCCVAASMFEALQYHQGPGKQWVARKLFHAWLASAALADILITVVLSWKLNAMRVKPGVRSTDEKIKRILYTVVPGGASTAIFQILILAVQAAFPGVPYYQFLIFCLSKIYSNSVILSFNLRDVKPDEPIMTDYTGMESNTSRVGYTTYEHSNDDHRGSRLEADGEQKGSFRSYGTDLEGDNRMQHGGISMQRKVRTYNDSSDPIDPNRYDKYDLKDFISPFPSKYSTTGSPTSITFEENKIITPPPPTSIKTLKHNQSREDQSDSVVRSFTDSINFASPILSTVSSSSFIQPDQRPFCSGSSVKEDSFEKQH